MKIDQYIRCSSAFMNDTFCERHCTPDATLPISNGYPIAFAIGNRNPVILTSRDGGFHFIESCSGSCQLENQKLRSKFD